MLISSWAMVSAGQCDLSSTLPMLDVCVTGWRLSLVSQTPHDLNR